MVEDELPRIALPALGEPAVEYQWRGRTRRIRPDSKDQWEVSDDGVRLRLFRSAGDGMFELAPMTHHREGRAEVYIGAGSRVTLEDLLTVLLP
jgi:hypothetical protein